MVFLQLWTIVFGITWTFSSGWLICFQKGLELFIAWLSRVDFCDILQRLLKTMVRFILIVHCAKVLMLDYQERVIFNICIKILNMMPI